MDSENLLVTWELIKTQLSLQKKNNVVFSLFTVLYFWTTKTTTPLSMLRSFFWQNSGNSCHQREMLCKPFITGWIPEATIPSIQRFGHLPSHQSRTFWNIFNLQLAPSPMAKHPPFCPGWLNPHGNLPPSISRCFFSPLFLGAEKTPSWISWVVGVQVGRFLSPQPSCKSETSMVSESRTSAPCHNFHVYLGGSLNGGIPISHPKMIIFSRKTHGNCWGITTILGNPHLENAHGNITTNPWRILYGAHFSVSGSEKGLGSTQIFFRPWTNVRPCIIEGYNSIKTPG